MKIALLLAGCARRFGEQTKNNHKALIEFDGTCVVNIMFERFVSLKVKDIVIVTGHCEEKLIKHIDDFFGKKLNIKYVYNSRYDQANNMVSLHCLKDQLKNEDFLLINGDLVLNSMILKKCLENQGKNFICVDDIRANQNIDSPAVEIANDRILELGRHLPAGHRHGYAIGMYGFNKSGSNAYFEIIEKYIQEKKMNAGFHDPLNDIFSEIKIEALSVEKYSWTDLDEPSDIDYVTQVFHQVLEQEKAL